MTRYLKDGSIKNFSFKGISKNYPFPLFWRGIKGEAKQKNEFLEMPLTVGHL